MKELKKHFPEQIDGFNGLLTAELKEGLLNFQTKELICVALACLSRCEYCIVYHVNCALKAGLKAEELIEAAMVSVIFGGGPTMSYISTILNECIKEFTDEECK
jgi:AhpD family alkylhydroperoxidase